MQELLRQWFLKHKRTLPFRNTQDPYLIWVAEVMSQQTRLEVVNDYFTKFIQAFPSIEILASSSLDRVIKVWEGLGYYARARNLFSGAKQILNQFQGRFPQTLEQLLQIKGIGPYSARAILSFAFHQKFAPVDGNVIRVITRFYAIDEPIEIASTKRKIQEFADSFLSEDKPQQISEALIELGSLVCKKDKPLCTSCPIKQECLAYLRNEVIKFPIKKKTPAPLHLKKTALIFLYKNQVFLKKNKVGLMKDLYEFPTIDGEKKKQQIFTEYVIEGKLIKEMKPIRGFFTKYKLDLFGFIVELHSEPNLPDCVMMSIDEIELVPFSSAHRRLMKELLQLYR